MKTTTLIIIALALLIGCKTTKPVETITRDSLVYKEVVKLDTFWTYTNADSALIEALVTCDSTSVAQLGEILLLSGKLNAKTSVKNGKLSIKITCEADSLKIVVANLEKELSKVSTQKETITVNVLTKWQKQQIIGFWILAGGLLLLIVLRFKKVV
jgi:hypothetical protein